jgi:hypothetical protein
MLPIWEEYKTPPLRSLLNQRNLICWWVSLKSSNDKIVLSKLSKLIEG